MSYFPKTVKEAHDVLSKKTLSVRDFVEVYLKEVKDKNENIRAYLEIYADVDEQITRAQKMFDEGKATLLTGIPIAIKDNILVRGELVTAGSKILGGYRASYDATVIEKLKKDGAILLGRTNMDEFAMGSSTETSFYGITKNPIAPTRTPGGSSGGSAASVAMNGAMLALGSDTGGSIRQPASHCGIVGLKPTYGRVSRYGLIAMGSSLDQIGPLSHTVADAEILFNAIAGEDKKDSTTLSSLHVAKMSRKEKETFTIGVPENFLSMDGLNKETVERFRETLKKLEERGHKIVSVDLDLLRYALPAYYIIMPAESSTNLARFDGVRYGLYKEGQTGILDYAESRGAGFGKEVRRRIMLGTYVLSAGYYDAYYNKAVAVKNALRADLTRVFESVDVIATPTTPAPAFITGEKTDPISMYLEDIFTVSANIAGNPALSIPVGKVSMDDEMLPVGFQIMGPDCSEEMLFRLGKEIETL